MQILKIHQEERILEMRNQNLTISIQNNHNLNDKSYNVTTETDNQVKAEESLNELLKERNKIMKFLIELNYFKDIGVQTQKLQREIYN